MFGFLNRGPMPLAGVLAVVLAAAGIALDWGTWLELNVSIVFTVPLVFAAAARNRALLWSLAVTLVCTTFVVYSLQMAPGEFNVHEPFFVDRLLSGATVLVVAMVLDTWMRLIDVLDGQGRFLSAQNDQLEAINRELIHHKEEVSRQNELLERRRQVAEDASGRKTRLLRSASHDIRTPVHAINLMAEVIRRTAENPLLAPKVPGLAQRLQANATSLAELLSEVLDVSSFDSGQVELRVSEFSLREILLEVCQRLSPLAQAKQLPLGIASAPNDIRLRSDRAKIMRILSNLVSNAIKFTQVGEVALQGGFSPQGSVLIQVRDTGSGIAPEDLERIFEEYTQAGEADTADSRDGWGLGLVICRRMARLIGGNILVESTPQKGSTFTLCLPASCIAQRPGDDRDLAIPEAGPLA